MSKLASRYSRAEMHRMRELYFPEERRHEFTSEAWDGKSFRHYLDPKIVCIEHFRPQHTLAWRFTPQKETTNA